MKKMYFSLHDMLQFVVLTDHFGLNIHYAYCMFVQYTICTIFFVEGHLSCLRFKGYLGHNGKL